MRVFLVEDDPIIIEGLKIALTQEGFEVEASMSMSEALEKIDSEAHFDVCLIDVMLPDGDGYTICRAIREKSRVPILFLTACDDEVHTVLALEQGADDYIAKPFRIRELMARIKAVLRRSGADMPEKAAAAKAGSGGASGAEAHESVKIGRNELNLMSGRVMRGGEEIFLTSAEYRLLLTFVRNRGRLLTRRQLLNDMWDDSGEFVNDNTLTVYVRRLRKKLEEDGDEPVINTVRGIGYRMD
ncbi:MAG: response regulator transcription factor [Lachnospiraceae bacterium]|nr:response regulator transcription factor [Lachnospiraceae bacterium]MBR5733384.1 response regulator transcription factor [Lachnospiraceae bacterium]